MPYANRHDKNIYDLQRYYRLRAEFFAGKRCAIGGGDDGLEIHHTDRATKESHRVWGWSTARREAELAKCAVVCRWCHQEHHAQERRRNPHGTTSAYRRGCRCVQCRAHHAARLRDYRRRRAAQEATR
jgi:hypothetical protein